MGWIIFLVCLVILVYLVSAPFYIEIDSGKELYSFRFHRLASARIVFNRDSGFYLKIKLIYWKKSIDLLKIKLKEKEMNAVLRNKNKARKRMSLITLKNILKSFKINRLFLSLDTGSMPLNGILFPVFHFIQNRTGKNIQINFMDENKLVLQIENNMARIIWAFIKSN